MPSPVSLFCFCKNKWRLRRGGVTYGIMFNHKYQNIITIQNLLATWELFICGKRHKKDVIKFQLELAKNLVELHTSLKNKTYTHGAYRAFNVSDPKPRHIHKATVRDRVLHRLIYKELYPYFNVRFIYDSYSCRLDKGTHKALDRFQYFAGQVSKNNTRTCYILKCDIKKFFANIDQSVLIKILKRHIEDEDILSLIDKVISSFYSTHSGIGLPLGNLTSQLLVNVYMHEFDMYLKQELMVKYYIRYADDFVILSDDKAYLRELLLHIQRFLSEDLRLTLHPDKIFIKSLASGVDFLGWVHFPDHKVLRTTTKVRMVKRIRQNPKPDKINSYLGLMGWGNTHRLKTDILKLVILC